jgi:hypothetical protein
VSPAAAEAARRAAEKRIDRKVDRHVVPLFGPEHEASCSCWCSPVVVHYHRKSRGRVWSHRVVH